MGTPNPRLLDGPALRAARRSRRARGARLVLPHRLRVTCSRLDLRLLAGEDILPESLLPDGAARASHGVRAGAPRGLARRAATARAAIGCGVRVDARPVPGADG